MEAGSGLIILDPVDISGGYTSVKEKTNISVISTDIYVHLSLSVISLILNLQNQAAAALQYGDADILSPCTRFDRIWVFPKGCFLCFSTKILSSICLLTSFNLFILELYLSLSSVICVD